MQKNLIIKIGDFLFKYRNVLFPAILVAMFLSRPPLQGVAFKEGAAILVTFFGLFVRAAVIGFAYIKRGGLNKQVYADKLVVEGFFGVCRNPLYVGNILIYLGVFMMHGDPLVFVAGNLLFLFIYYCIVQAEEFFLRGKFGADFDAYCAQVPRWLPKLGKLKAATEGMKFNFKRVLAKDYSTIMNAVFTLAIIQLYQEALFYSQINYGLYATIIAVVVVAGLSVRKLKKTGKLKAD